MKIPQTPPPPLVSCRIYGQLGNQLYQIATTLSYAWDYQAVPVFPALHTQAFRISLNKDRIFFRLNASQPIRPFIHEFKESCWFSSSPVPFREDQLLDGYFQSWRHFDRHREKLQCVFSPSPFTLNVLSQKYGDLLQRDDTVAVHVRTQTRENHEAGHHPFLGLDYYTEAIEKFPKDSTFVVCSDRINWCKNNFKRFGRSFLFIEGNYAVEDFFLLAKMRHIIVCNSSFSWWAAYLYDRPGRTVIAPRLVKDPRLQVNPPVEDFYPVGWTLLDYNLYEPYPADMYNYDACSQSWNG